MTPVVLIHGLFGTLDAPEILAEFGNRNALAPPLLGYGKNAQVDTSTLTLQVQAEHVAQFIEVDQPPLVDSQLPIWRPASRRPPIRWP